MREESRPERADAISAEDAERLLTGAALDEDARPLLTTLHEVLAAARRPGDEQELAQTAQVVAAFRAARSTTRHAVPRRDHRLRALTRRTVAIIGISTGASLSVAVATGAVDNPFIAPPPVEHGPATTSRPLVPSLTVASDSAPRTAPPNAPAAVDTSIGDDGQASGGAYPDAGPIERGDGESSPPSPPSSLPGEVLESPSVTAPGQTGTSPALPGPEPAASPSVPTPGPAGSVPVPSLKPVESPPVTTPEPVESPPVTVPAPVGSPPVTVPAPVESPSVTAPAPVGTPSATAPGRIQAAPAETAPGQRRPD